MIKIQINSVESVIFFVLYICAQDGKISDAELNELALEFPLVEKLYFDKFEGELSTDAEEPTNQAYDDAKAEEGGLGAAAPEEDDLNAGDEEIELEL